MATGNRLLGTPSTQLVATLPDSMGQGNHLTCQTLSESQIPSKGMDTLMAKGRNKIVDAGAINDDMAANLDTTREVALSEFDATRAQYDTWKGGLSQDMFDRWTKAYTTGAWFALPKAARLDADKPSANDMLKRYLGLPANTDSNDPRVVSIRNDSDYIRLRSGFAKAAGKKGRKVKVTVETVAQYLTRNLGKIKVTKADPEKAAAMLADLTAFVEKVKAAHAGASSEVRKAA